MAVIVIVIIKTNTTGGRGVIKGRSSASLTIDSDVI